MLNNKLPAYPLFLSDPFFSIWSASERLNETDTMFWNGQVRKTYGLVRHNNTTYSFLGRANGTVALEQKSVTLSAFTTDYAFECDDFELDISFISPLTPDNLELLSCPVCYLSYDVRFKGEKSDDFSVALFLDEMHCYDKTPQPVRGGVHRTSPYETAYFGLFKQTPMSQTGDSHAADYGYTYITGDEAFYTSRKSVDKFIACGVAEYDLNEYDKKYIFAVNKGSNGRFMVAFDDTCSINYFGDWLKNYFFKDGRNIFDALTFSHDNYALIIDKLNAFDKELKELSKDYGEEYLHVLYASLRQSVAAHKLVANNKGEILFLSKECHSNGCIATVDVSYPSTPLYLLYNPELVRGMLRPIFDFANKPVWEFDFAPHDAGTYPSVCGQVYGMKQKNDKYHANNIYLKDGNGLNTHMMFSDFPKGSDIYEFKYQMPVEECANMIIMTAAAIKADDNHKIAEDNFDLLKKWVLYLKDYGLVPDNQLCTDDFAGHLDKNVNLSVKAIVGIRAFSYIAKILGDNSLADEYQKLAEKYAIEWKNMVKDYSPIPLAFGKKDSFSLKYNIAFDKLFGFNLFDSEICESETDFYIKKSNKYGIPLDSRDVYTKSDWLVWASSLTDDKEKSKKLIIPLYNYLCKSETKVPFSDWYDTKTAKAVGFQNRTVQGGNFILLLKDNAKLKL